MKIGNYILGRYHSVIEKKWEDGSLTYETNFTSEADLGESVRAIDSCIGLVCGIATDKPMRLVGMNVYRGKEAVKVLKSLGNIKEKSI